MNIYGLKLLQIVTQSDQRMQNWNFLFHKTLNQENTQTILSLALRLKNPVIVKYALEILRECPLEAIANTICGMESTEKFMMKNCQNRVFVKQKVNHHLQENIEKSIDKILGARSADEVVKKGKTMEIFNFLLFIFSLEAC